MRKKNPIRINEAMLHNIIKESVKNVLRENQRSVRCFRRRGLNESYFDLNDKILRQYGLNPKLVEKLNSPDMIPYHNADYVDEEDEVDYTNDFGIEADDGDIRIHISGSEYSEREDGGVVDTVKDMCQKLKKGESVEDIWYGISFDWSL